VKADKISDILILLIGHKDWKLVSLSFFTLRSWKTKLQQIFATQPKIVVESSANMLRIKTAEFDCRPQNGLRLILLKPSEQTAEKWFKMDLQRYLRNPSHFKLHNRPNTHHCTPYVNGRFEQHLLPHKETIVVVDLNLSPT
jgi:hypothetical protein